MGEIAQQGEYSRYGSDLVVSKITLVIILIVGSLIVISLIPKQISRSLSIFLILFGIIAFIIAVVAFGFKESPIKEWWEN